VGREDTVRSALDIISVCAILPRVQMALCENVAFPGEKTKGCLSSFIFVFTNFIAFSRVINGGLSTLKMLYS
jgi:hypothetical protein